MKNKRSYLGRAIYMGGFLMLGCSSSGTLGCGSSSGAGPTVDSELFGVYQITRYQGSQEGCDQLTDIVPAPGYLALYSFRPIDNPEEARLGGIFCGDVNSCRASAREAPQPGIGYSFLSGDDASGWQGWAITSTGNLNDQCRADVQAHTLQSAGAEPKISIDTRTTETVFPPILDGNQATCRNADAIASLNDDLPCKALLVLEATFEASL